MILADSAALADVQALALDFDGVIWDSVGECWVLAGQVWRSLYGTVPPGTESRFRRGRWLVRHGGEFLILLQLLRDYPDQDLQEFSAAQYERLCGERADAVAEFAVALAERRRSSRESDFAWWSGLQAPFAAFAEIWPLLQRRFPYIYLCTTKDEPSARALLASGGLEMPVIGREFSLDKREHLRRVAREHDLVASQILFIDDLLTNLDQVRELGTHLVLASWGYNTPHSRALAQAQGIPVLDCNGLRSYCGL